LYERAIAADPKHASSLGNYALFLCDERRDLDRAQELFERALAADPMRASSLGNYASFLRVERRDLDRAQELYERAIAADPMRASSLGNYANFLCVERRDLDRAQELFERALAADPKDASSLGNYANFLCDERRDFDRAQELYERAIAISVTDIDTRANFAHALFLAGRRSRATEQLREAIKLGAAKPDAVPQALASEIAFYRAVHLSEERDDALRMLRTLVAKGALSRGWNFRAHTSLAETSGDPDAPLFAALADVLSGTAEASTLERFARWTH
jgi:Tfp pilus assembly protein PilF